MSSPLFQPGKLYCLCAATAVITLTLISDLTWLSVNIVFVEFVTVAFAYFSMFVLFGAFWSGLGGIALQIVIFMALKMFHYCVSMIGF